MASYLCYTTYHFVIFWLPPPPPPSYKKTGHHLWIVCFYLFCALSPRLHIHPCAFVKVDKQKFQDFGISTGKRRACTYLFSQNTCGGPGGTKEGRSWNQQRAETLMTVTGWIRGSFVSTALCTHYSDSLKPLPVLHSKFKFGWYPIFSNFFKKKWIIKPFYVTFQCGC